MSWRVNKSLLDQGIEAEFAVLISRGVYRNARLHQGIVRKTLGHFSLPATCPGHSRQGVEVAQNPVFKQNNPDCRSSKESSGSITPPALTSCVDIHLFFKSVG
jgi:hypothetical protein